MTRKKGKGTYILAVILSAAMVFTSIPYTALAAEGEADFAAVKEQTEQTEEAENGAEDVSGSDENSGTGETSNEPDDSNIDIETDDVSDNSDQDTQDVSGSGSEASVSGNNIKVYSAEETATGSLLVEGNSGSYSYDTENDVITVKDGAELTFHSAEGYGKENPSQTRIYVEKDASATLTLDGVYIDVSEQEASPLEIAEDSAGAVSLILKASNILTAGETYAGIQKNGTAKGTLSISGSGYLSAWAGRLAAGIGGGNGKTGSNITISGGNVTATGGEYGAGIGGGYQGDAGNITISGGTITATMRSSGSDIGAGAEGSTGMITITGGSVKTTKNRLTGVTNGTDPVYYTEVDLTAEYGTSAAVRYVGETTYGVKDMRTDADGKIYLYLPANENETTIVFGTHFYSGIVSAEDGADNCLTMGTECKYSLLVLGDPAYYERSESTQGILIKDGANLIIKSAKGYGRDNYSQMRIQIEENASATLTLDGAYLDASNIAYVSSPLLIPEKSTGNVNIVLKGENALKAGTYYAAIQKGGYYEEGGILTISGDGSLTATGGDYGAGIGSGYRCYGNISNITINGGTITATGGKEGAGIGGGSGGGSNITINGGTVTANGGENAAGIGGGSGKGSNITINGGTVTATGGKYGAGIGGGFGTGDHITITGGTITATGGENAAGIGGGAGGAGSDIIISGGLVTATAEARIGYNGYINAGAGIGGGVNGDGSDITITGGTVIATARAIGQAAFTGAGIGGGFHENGNNITISGGTVTATAIVTEDNGTTGAGIGGGYLGDGNNITISGGTVTAISSVTGDFGRGGAGIGGGHEGNANVVTISGGNVTALSTAEDPFNTGYGIGGGWGSDGGILTVTGGNMKASSLFATEGKNGDEQYQIYPARVDLQLLAGKNAAVGNPKLQTYNTKTGEIETISYNLSDVRTMEDGYLYLFLPVDREDTVTRLVFDNAVYEAKVAEFEYDLYPDRFNDFTLKSSTDGKADYGEVLREDVPEDGIIPSGIWMSELQAGGYTYTGKAITPSFRVYDGKKMLTVKKDYTVSYKNNIKAATAEDAKKAPTITVKSTGNYKGTETRTFTINPVSLKEGAEQRIKADDLYLAAPSGKNTKGIKAVPVVTDNGKKLVENRDYTINHVTLNEKNEENKNKNSYVDPGKYTIEIVGKGNYTGTRQITVILADVAKEQILMSKVTVAKIADVTYDESWCVGSRAEGLTPSLTVTYGSGKNKVTLYKKGDVNAEGQYVSETMADYTVTWINNKKVGTATAVLTGTGKIEEDGTVSGTYFGEKRVTFKIKGAALSSRMVDWASGSKSVSIVYNGEEQKPEVRVSQQKKVKDENGKTVTQTVNLREYDDYSRTGDYKVSYLKNVDAGTATVVVTGINGYTGTVKKTFKITPADLAAEGTEAKIAAASGSQSNASGSSQGTSGSNDPADAGAIKVTYAKSGAKPAVVVTAKLANGNTVTLKEGRDYTLSCANNKAVSEGKNLPEKKLPVVTVKGKGNYKGSVKQNYIIMGKSLADTVNPFTVTVTDVAASKNKGKFVSKPVVTDEHGVKLKEKTDYTLSYSLLTENGTLELDTKTGIVSEPGSLVRVTITGAGNYQCEGSVLTADYRITELSFSKATVKVVPKTLPYTKKPVTLTGNDLIVTMKVGTGKQAVVEELPLIADGDDTKDGYQIIGYTNNVNKGTAQVILKGCGRYGGTKTVKFYIGTRPFLWWLGRM